MFVAEVPEAAACSDQTGERWRVGGAEVVIKAPDLVTGYLLACAGWIPAYAGMTEEGAGTAEEGAGMTKDG